MELMDPLDMVSILTGAGLLLSALETWSSRAVFRHDGLLSWDISRLQNTWSAAGPTGALLDVVERDATFTVLILVRGLAALALIVVPIDHPLFLGASGALAVALVLLSLRSRYGLDGAHQMFLLLVVALWLGSLAGPESLGRRLCVWFIAGQAALSYLVAGLAKLGSERWRSGGALIGILGTEIYGHAGAHAFFAERPRLAQLACWGVFVFEIAFPVVFVLPAELAVGMLIAALAFHLVNAVLMGLNTFLFAFAATYPAILAVVL